MSHIVEIKNEVRDETAISAACQRLQLEAPTHGTVKLFSDSATGTIVKLPAWRYPAVFDTQSGQARFDNFEGRWGEQHQLDRFLQGYAVEKTKIEARKKGHTITEQSQADGSIKLTVSVGGAA
jgi:hypothetical protein